MDLEDIFAEESLAGVSVGHISPPKAGAEASGDVLPRAGEDLPESYVSIQSLAETGQKRKATEKTTEKGVEGRKRKKKVTKERAEVTDLRDGKQIFS